MLVVWNVVMLGNAAINVAEVVLAKVALESGNVGFGVLVGAGGLGLTLGSFASGTAVDRIGLGRAVRARDRADGGRLRDRRRSRRTSMSRCPRSCWRPSATAPRSSATRSSSSAARPDELRGRAFTVIMSSNYALLGVGMVAAGALTGRVRRSLGVGRRRRGVSRRGACSRVALAPRRREELISQEAVS